MQIHRLRRRASAVLAVFIATLGVTLFAPVVEKSGYRLVCSVAGSKRVANDDANGSAPAPGTDTHAAGAAHCPLCLPLSPPSAVVAWTSARAAPVDAVAHRLASLAFDRAVGAPLPARGPPSVS